MMMFFFFKKKNIQTYIVIFTSNQLLCICYGLVVNREFYKMDYKLDPMIEAVSFHVDSPYFENDIL